MASISTGMKSLDEVMTLTTTQTVDCISTFVVSAGDDWISRRFDGDLLVDEKLVS